jgi:hypothetical protein
MRAAGADALTPLKSAMSICLFLFQTRSLSTASKATSKASPTGDVGNATGLGAAIALDQVHFIWSSSGSPSAGPPGSRLRLSYRTSKR